jgi:Mg-chelatase subunit ChlD
MHPLHTTDRTTLVDKNNTTKTSGYVTPIMSPIPHTGLTFVSSIPAVSATKSVDLGEAFKPKRAGKNPNLSHIVFVLDESSSMVSCWEQTIAGYNEYLKAQKEDAEKTGIKTLVSLFKFNGYHVDLIFDRRDVTKVAPLTKIDYRPSGGTNLLDAIGGVLMRINALLMEKKKDYRESVIVTILTDGEENQSRTFNNAEIKSMVEKAEGKNWGFMFLGANINAFHASSALGFNINNTMQYDTAVMSNAMRSASNMTSRMKSAYASGLDTSAAYDVSAFTDTERSSTVAKDDK